MTGAYARLENIVHLDMLPTPDPRLYAIREHGLAEAPGLLAFDSLYRQFNPQVVRVCDRALRVQPDRGYVVEDVAQDTWFAAAQVLPDPDRLPIERSLAPWLCKVALHKCIDTMRKRGTRQHLAAVDQAVLRDSDWGSPALDPESVTGGFTSTMELLKPMREEWRRHLVCTAMGVTDTQLAKMEGAPLGSTKSRIRLARKEAVALLESAGISKAE